MTNLSIHQENKIWRGWTFKGSHRHFIDDVENISFSVIWAFSENKFNGLIINPQINNQYTFQHFLRKLMDSRKKEIENINKKFCIIYDNASFHKTKGIQKFAIINRLIILTIPPYWPVLSKAEKLILSIKKKFLIMMR